MSYPAAGGSVRESARRLVDISKFIFGEMVWMQFQKGQVALCISNARSAVIKALVGLWMFRTGEFPANYPDRVMVKDLHGCLQFDSLGMPDEMWSLARRVAKWQVSRPSVPPEFKENREALEGFLRECEGLIAWVEGQLRG